MVKSNATSQGGAPAVIPAGGMDELRSNAARASSLLKSMSNRARLLVLCQLVTGEKSVGQLEAQLDLSQSALSQHLAVLRRANLVKTRREAQSIYYSLAGDEAVTVMSALHALYCAAPTPRPRAKRAAAGKSPAEPVKA